jgi:hypothetical protein
MGFRFRKSIKLFPGLRLNISKSGISTSIGVPGATVNISKRGTRGTVGIPGTGISYSETLSKPSIPHSNSNPVNSNDSPDSGGVGALLVLGIFVFFIFVFSAIVFIITR